MLINGVRDNDQDVLRPELFKKWLSSEHAKKDFVCFACSKRISQEHELLKHGNVVAGNGHVQDVIEFSENVHFGSQGLSLHKVLKDCLESVDGSDEETYVLICGNQNGMGKEVQHALTKSGIVSSDKIDAMKSSGAYLMELWGE